MRPLLLSGLALLALAACAERTQPDSDDKASGASETAAAVRGQNEAAMSANSAAQRAVGQDVTANGARDMASATVFTQVDRLLL